MQGGVDERKDEGGRESGPRGRALARNEDQEYPHQRQTDHAGFRGDLDEVGVHVLRMDMIKHVRSGASRVQRSVN